jgi:hypothetical protein
MNYTRMPRVEAAPVQSRVCDEAYVLLRRMIKPSEDRQKQDENSHIFLRLPEVRRDIEIRRARNSQPWTDSAAEVNDQNQKPSRAARLAGAGLCGFLGRGGPGRLLAEGSSNIPYHLAMWTPWLIFGKIVRILSVTQRFSSDL